MSHYNRLALLQTQGNQYVLGCLQAELVRNWGLLIWRQDDWRPISKCCNPSLILRHTACHSWCITHALYAKCLFSITRKPWRKRRKRKRRPRRSLTPFINWFFISVAPLSQKRRMLFLLLLSFVTCSSLRLTESCGWFCHYSKLDVDHLYMSYADIMAKVSRHRAASSIQWMNGWNTMTRSQVSSWPLL